MGPVQHGGEKRIRLVRNLAADEWTVEVRNHTLELGEGVNGDVDEALPHRRGGLVWDLRNETELHVHREDWLGGIEVRLRVPCGDLRHRDPRAKRADVLRLVGTLVVGHLGKRFALPFRSREDLVEFTHPLVRVRQTSGSALHRGGGARGELLQEPSRLVPHVDEIRLEGDSRFGE